MYKKFKELLETASGRSEHVIVVNLDIRGFSSFCNYADSLNTAIYISRVYKKILTDYFKDTTFHKPTGDGLIIIISYNSKNLKEKSNEIIETCLKLEKDFSTLVSDDPMINFSTPKHIGIGISRGSACCIESEDNILDYSGRVLNLASRLMDMARPSGLVIDESFQLDLLNKDTKELFVNEEVYVRGLSTTDPIVVHCTESTFIPEVYKKPPNESEWKTDEYPINYLELKNYAAQLMFSLKPKPLDEKRIYLTMSFTNPKTGNKIEVDFSTKENTLKVERIGNKHKLVIKKKLVLGHLSSHDIPDDQQINFELNYPVMLSK